MVCNLGPKLPVVRTDNRRAAAISLLFGSVESQASPQSRQEILDVIESRTGNEWEPLLVKIWQLTEVILVDVACRILHDEMNWSPIVNNQEVGQCDRDKHLLTGVLDRSVDFLVNQQELFIFACFSRPLVTV